MTINEAMPEIERRFWNAATAALTEAQKLKLKAIKYFMFNPAGKDLVKAADMLSEIGF